MESTNGTFLNNKEIFPLEANESEDDEEARNREERIRAVSAKAQAALAAEQFRRSR